MIRIKLCALINKALTVLNRYVERKVSDPTCKILREKCAINFHIKFIKSTFRGQTALIIRNFFRPFKIKHKLHILRLRILQPLNVVIMHVIILMVGMVQILFLTLALEKLFLVLLLWGVTRRNFKLFPADLIFSTTSACELHFISLKNHEIISK